MKIFSLEYFHNYASQKMEDIEKYLKRKLFCYDCLHVSFIFYRLLIR